MMKRESFEKAGMFSEEYFMYAEDLDLCYKMKRLGLENYYLGEAQIIHHGGKSSSQSPVSQWSTFMKLRAVQKFCSKTHGRLYALLYRAAIGTVAAVRLFLIALMRFLGRATANGISLRSSSLKWRAVLKWALFPNSLESGNIINR
jgi:GT2 family glycosyltransferase